MTTPNLPGNLTTAQILDAVAARKARKKAAARKLRREQLASERQAQADAWAVAECNGDRPEWAKRARGEA